MPIKHISTIFKELIICIILGTAPLIISWYHGGQSAITAMIKSLQTTGFVLNYALVLFLFYFAVVIVRRLILMKTQNIKSFVMFLESIFSQVGNGLQGIFRISTGIAIALPVIWFFIERATFQIKMALICFGWGILLLFVCCLLSYIHYWLDGKLTEKT